jgi:cytochrome o ubiquinol oxidase subunit 1
MIVAELGAIVIFCGILATIAQLVISIRTRERRRDLSGDPWNGRTLEWSTASPPPAYNFAILPQVESLDAFWAMKQSGRMASTERYGPIDVPRNSATGFVTAFFAVVTGFALVWHIWWMAILGLACAVLTLLAFGWIERVGEVLSVEQLASADRARSQLVSPA